MQLLCQVNGENKLVNYRYAMVFRDQATIYENGEYLILASGLYWGNGAKMRITVNGRTVAHGSETASYAGTLLAGDKVNLVATNLMNTHLMLYELK